MKRLPSLLALRAFESAARLRSFALAAEELHLTPSAISHQVKAVEVHFAKPLFVRSHRGVALTGDGETLLRALTPAFEQVEAACACLDDRLLTSTLAVHSSPSFASQWLGPRLAAFLRDNRRLGIRLSSSADRVDLLRHEELDVLIRYGTAPVHPAITNCPLGEEDVAALASPATAARIEAAGDAGWTDATLIESSISPVRWSDWFAHNRLPDRPTGPAFDRGALSLAAAAQDLGVALETKRFARDELASGALVEVGPNQWRSIRRQMHWLCYRSAAEHSAKIETFRGWLLAEAHAEAIP